MNELDKIAEFGNSEELVNEPDTVRLVVSRLLKQMEKENPVKLERNNVILL